MLVIITSSIIVMSFHSSFNIQRIPKDIVLLLFIHTVEMVSLLGQLFQIASKVRLSEKNNLKK